MARKSGRVNWVDSNSEEDVKLWPAINSWFGLFFGLIWIFLYPIATLSTGELKTRGTYFSENALLVRVATPNIDTGDKNKAIRYHQEYVAQEQLPPSGCGDACRRFIPFLVKQLEALDIETYLHSFEDQGKNRTNVYGIVRGSSGADSREALVMVASYNTIGTNFKQPTSAMAVGIAIMEYLSTVKWLSKDVILLLADDGGKKLNKKSSGVQSWIQAYHAGPFEANSLPMHAGAIRASLILDIADTSKLTTVTLLGAGINGQLPNLDLVNTAVAACRYERIPVALDLCETVHASCRDLVSFTREKAMDLMNTYAPSEYKPKLQTYLTELFTQFRFMRTVAIGPSGSHANFISYNIESITMLAAQSKINYQKVDLLSYMRTVEVVMRSLSNIEEKFHQSFYFYLMTHQNKFVSIGEYYYSLALIALPSLWQLASLCGTTADIRLVFGGITLALSMVTGWGFLMFTQAISTLDRRNLEALGIYLGHPLSHEQMLLYFFGLAFILELILVFAVINFVRTFRICSGSTGEAQWQIADARKEARKEIEAAKKEGILLETDAELEERIQRGEFPGGLLQSDDGWRGVKAFAMGLVAFANYFLGIVNFTFALFCAIATIPYSLITPAKAHNSIFTTILTAMVLTCMCPCIAVVGLEYAYGDVMSSFLAFASQPGSCVLPYFYLVYFPLHVLSVVVFTTPSVAP